MKIVIKSNYLVFQVNTLSLMKPIRANKEKEKLL